jgi:ATP-dependent exoDNAse (exonuclease V) beta subunit
MKIFTHIPIVFQEIHATTTPKGRFYETPDGKHYPSVTTVLAQHSKQGVLEWRQRVGEAEADKISRQSATRGTKFHNMAEHYLKNVAYTEKLSLLDREIFELSKPTLENINNIRALEVPLFSHHLRLAGRVDCIAEYNKKLSIIDFKTARREKTENYIQHYFMQAAAYAIMFEERTGIPIVNLTIIIAVDDGVVQVFQSKRDMHVKDLLHYRDMFEREQK